MAELILNARHWTHSPCALDLDAAIVVGAEEGVGWSDLPFAEPLPQFFLACPSLRLPQCTPPHSKHFEKQKFESCRQLSQMGFPGGHLHFHHFSEPFQRPQIQPRVFSASFAFLPKTRTVADNTDVVATLVSYLVLPPVISSSS